ncbi:PINc/VapC family ATPase [Candidatus Woesearchaeota archaeon]|nr:PINc/VapC family ATPase [Candidatus Woesearchaeota archaeon]
MEKIVPDTSIIIEGLLSSRISKKEFKVAKVIVHEAVFAELEHQANEGKAIGFLGLEELKKLRELADKLKFEIVYAGKRPSGHDIKYASLGEIDASIRQLAWEEDATLLTGDTIQAEAARAKGVKVILIAQEISEKKLKLEKYFDEATMSVHLRENVVPYAKKGMPGKWDFVALAKKLLTQDEVKGISNEIIEEARVRNDGFIEIERNHSTIVQLGKYRIVITAPPFSDGWEITAVRPVKKLVLDDYKLSEKLMTRVAEQAEGILIAGAPGHGKTTFAQALAEFYASKEKVVKTVEAPRDLVLPDSVTQYAISRGTPQEIHDILLLCRPDYTIFDEMRNTGDFKLFADMRLAGVGMVGVVHATNPIDAIQRFIGRIEMGVIPQVIDTVVFIKNGGINEVLSVKMTVKVPSGMTEADLARPVVEVVNFETGKIEFEIYTYGEQTVVVPVTKGSEVTGAHKLAEKTIEDEFRKYTDNPHAEVVSAHKVIVKVPARDIPRIIGKQGQNIDRIEEKLGISIDIQELGSGSEEKGKTSEAQYELRVKSKSINIFLDITMQNKEFDIYTEDEYLLSAKAGKTGVIKIKKDNPIGRRIIKALQSGERIRLLY